jgi:F0F1-type ATP synthase assembly protein I
MTNKELDILKKQTQDMLNRHGENKHHRNPGKVSIMLNCSLEIISGIIVGVVAGYYLDKYFKTKWLIIPCVILGFGAGVINLHKYMKKIKDI